MNSIETLKNNYHTLTRKQKAIADYLLANPETVCYITLRELSQRTSATEVTILRMCKRLGFKNYIDLKKAFRAHTLHLIHDLDAPNYLVPKESFSEPDEKARIIQQICKSEFNASKEFYQFVDPSLILQAAKLLLKAKQILIVGQGISRIVSQFLYNRIVPLGVNASLLDPMDMSNVQARLSKLFDGDVVVTISFPQYCTPVRNIAQYAEIRGASVIAITDNPQKSPAVTQKSLNFLCNTSTKVFYNSLSLPFALVNLIASGIVLEMGTEYRRKVEESNEIIHFVSGDTQST
ncbi:MAG: MurR/RpiR family transcriptional regulator [Oscillospiraceae bacterium]|jgi:DNA-binding MurR/RpiR family transcriptional regulator|nr:MurR/RpiR family transcriptional regulator [Oscillospiraceae bacterium]